MLAVSNVGIEHAYYSYHAQQHFEFEIYFVTKTFFLRTKCLIFTLKAPCGCLCKQSIVLCIHSHKCGIVTSLSATLPSTTSVFLHVWPSSSVHSMQTEGTHLSKHCSILPTHSWDWVTVEGGITHHQCQMTGSTTTTSQDKNLSTP